MATVGHMPVRERNFPQRATCKHENENVALGSTRKATDACC